MKTIQNNYIIPENEIDFLKSLLGKDLCEIGSDTLSVNPSNPDILKFYKWIEFIVWNNNQRIKLEYTFDETYSLDDIIKFQVELYKKNRKSLNAHISFVGDDIFKIQKIETYGYDSKYKVNNFSGNQPSEELKADENYIEEMSIENIILIYSFSNKKIFIECDALLNITVTMNENYINNKLLFAEPEFGTKMILKRTLK